MRELGGFLGYLCGVSVYIVWSLASQVGGRKVQIPGYSHLNRSLSDLLRFPCFQCILSSSHYGHLVRIDCKAPLAESDRTSSPKRNSDDAVEGL